MRILCSHIKKTNLFRLSVVKKLSESENHYIIFSVMFLKFVKSIEHCDVKYIDLENSSMERKEYSKLFPELSLLP